MPFYDYKCEICSANLEVIHSITETPNIKCKFCGGKTKKIFSPAGIIFKGSGFYKTDSKTKSVKTDSCVEGSHPTNSLNDSSSESTNTK